MADDVLVIANVIDHVYFRRGARVVVVNPNHGNGSDRMIVRGLSKGGRPVTAWIGAKQLHRWRVKRAPAGTHPSAHRFAEEYAVSWCRAMNGA